MEIDNQSLQTQSQLDAHSKPIGSFGHRFKQARVAQGLTLENVADELFILRRHLEAIEHEDFKSLPQAAFARGFVINYAKHLKLDPVQMAESFDRAYPEELKKKSVNDIESPLRPMGTLQREGNRSWSINPLLIIGVIGVVALAVVLLRVVLNAQDTNDNEIVNETTELTDSEQSAGAALGNVDNNHSGSAINQDEANLSNNSQNNAISNSNSDNAALSSNGSALNFASDGGFNTNQSNNADPNSSNTLNSSGSAIELSNTGSAINSN